MKKHKLKLVLSFCLIILLTLSLPYTVFGISRPPGKITDQESIFANGHTIYAEDYETVPPRQSVTGVEYNPATKTLTLNNFTGSSIVVRGLRNMTLILKGTNKIISRGNNNVGFDASLGTNTNYYHGSNISVRGGGSLSITAANSRRGMYAGSLQILEGCSLSISTSYKDYTGPLSVFNVYVDTNKGSSLTLYAKNAPKSVALSVCEKPFIRTSKNAVLKEGATPGTAVAVKAFTFNAWDESRPFVSIMPKQRATGVTLNITKKGLVTGQSFRIKAVVQPKTAYDKTVLWKSSNPKVASVDNKGIVKALSKGSATITARAKTGGKSVSCKINVKTNNKK